MQNNKRDIDQLFSGKLSGAGVQPSPVVWDRIAQDLGHQRKRRRVLFLWSLSGAASLIFAFLLGWYLAGDSSNQDELLAELKHYRIEQKMNPISANIEQELTIHIDRPTLLAYNKDFMEETPADRSNKHKSEQMHLMSPIQTFHIRAEPLSQELLAHNDALYFSEADRAIIASNKIAMNIETNENQKEEAWAVGLQGSPVYRFDQAASKSYLTSDKMSNAKQGDISTYYTPNVSGGLSVSYQSKGKFSFVSGINYNSINQSSEDIALAFAGHNWLTNRNDTKYEMSDVDDTPQENSTSNSVIFNTDLGLSKLNMPGGMQLASSDINYSNNTASKNADYQQSVDYLEIPLLMRYQLIEKRWGLHLLGGINTNLLVSNQAELVNNDKVLASGVIEGLNPVTFSSSIGMGMNYYISEQLILNVEPTLKVSLNPMSRVAGFSSRPYSFGFFSGISYQF